MRNDNKKLYDKLCKDRDNLMSNIIVSRGCGKTNMSLRRHLVINMYDIAIEKLKCAKTKMTMKDVLDIFRIYADVREVQYEE